MKNITYYFAAILALVCTVTVNAQYDDLYDDPYDVIQPEISLKETTEDLDLAQVNVSDNGYEQSVNQPYKYSSQIRRFNDGYSGFGYYDPIYIDEYYFEGSTLGSTIYPDYSESIFDTAEDVETFASNTSNTSNNTSPSFSRNPSIFRTGSFPGRVGYGGYSRASAYGYGGYNYCPINTGTVAATPTSTLAARPQTNTARRTVTNSGNTNRPVYSPRTPTRTGESGRGSVSFPSSRTSTPTRTSTPSRRSTPSRSSGGSRY